MLIRSQNREFLINFNNSILINFNNSIVINIMDIEGAVKIVGRLYKASGRCWKRCIFLHRCDPEMLRCLCCTDPEVHIRNPVS